MYYILENRVPVRVGNIDEWFRLCTPTMKRVDETFINDVHISTVFLGMDHSFGGGTPVLFETMIFGGKLNDYQWRYTTWDEAIEGHQKAVQMCREEENIIKSGGTISFKLT